MFSADSSLPQLWLMPRIEQRTDPPKHWTPFSLESGLRKERLRYLVFKVFGSAKWEPVESTASVGDSGVCLQASDVARLPSSSWCVYSSSQTLFSLPSLTRRRFCGPVPPAWYRGSIPGWRSSSCSSWELSQWLRSKDENKRSPPRVGLEAINTVESQRGAIFILPSPQFGRWLIW